MARGSYERTPEIRAKASAALKGRTRPVLPRFMAKVHVSENCWEWTGAKVPSGYGRFLFEGRLQVAPRVAYQLFVGPIDEGLELDHLCRNPGCVNPAHLEPVTHRENCLRADTPAARNAKKTHCKNGHPFNEENTLWRKNGDRVCRECRKRYKREYYHRTKGDRLPPTQERTHCPRGHPYDEENTYILPKSGGRVCRTCARERYKRSTPRSAGR